jgi:hypothetical protein
MGVEPTTALVEKPLPVLQTGESLVPSPPSKSNPDNLLRCEQSINGIVHDWSPVPP